MTGMIFADEEGAVESVVAEYVAAEASEGVEVVLELVKAPSRHILVAKVAPNSNVSTSRQHLSQKLGVIHSLRL